MTAIEVKDIDRFWSHVGPETTRGCRVWTGSVRNGYGAFSLMGGNIDAHRFGCILQHGLPPQPGLQAAHNCRNRLCVVHVSWKTPKQNQADRRRDGTHLEGERHPAAKLTEVQVREIRAAIKNGEQQKDIAARYGISQPLVSDIKLGRRWKHLLDTPNNA